MRRTWSATLRFIKICEPATTWVELWPSSESCLWCCSLSFAQNGRRRRYQRLSCLVTTFSSAFLQVEPVHLKNRTDWLNFSWLAVMYCTCVCVSVELIVEIANGVWNTLVSNQVRHATVNDSWMY
jgi:hypothetical protein